MIQLTQDHLNAIREWNTCAVADAIETFDVRLRNEGYAVPGLKCVTGNLPPMLGYAATCKVKSDNPPPVGHSYYNRTDWWSAIGRLPTPRVAVIEDIDLIPGHGSSVGQAHAAILKALSCAGVVTNGSVRDVPVVAEMEFPMFSGSVSVSHSYAHLVEFGEPVQIFGLKIQSGDLLYADCHGILSIPLSIAAEIPGVAAGIARKKRTIVDFCQSPAFSVDELRKLVHRF
jgi:4-hydroxy-4-methyl-2-oxoglutarate aldolase